MKKLVLLLLLVCVRAWAAPCPVTVGTLTLRVTQPRASAISPALLFFDATTTTDTSMASAGGSPPAASMPIALPNTYQDIYYTWDFGDQGVTGGTAQWSYGTNGQPYKNKATGPVAAHLYVVTPGGGDKTTTVQLWAYDGTNVATCTVSVTVFDSSGANGYAGNKTTCVAATTTPVAGSGGCPAGAAVLQQSNIGTALSAYTNGGGNHQWLFKCGDTFTGSAALGSFTTAVSNLSLGAYGGCENTTTNRPIISSTGGIGCITWSCVIALFDAVRPVDVRFANLDFESSAQQGIAIGSDGIDTSTNPVKDGETQITMYNLNATGYAAGFWLTDGTQSGLIQSTVIGKALQGYTSYWNWAGNHCVNGNTALNCGGTPNFVPVDYNAFIGNNEDGAPNSGPGNPPAEILRLPACRFCVVSNNRLANSSNNWGATLKFLNANGGGATNWLGQYTEYTVISDNLLTGTSGAIMGSIAPTNNTFDERPRFILLERNWIQGGIPSGTFPGGAAKFLISASNVTVRNNLMTQVPGCTGSNCSDYGFQISQNGVEPVPQHVEVYNNTCYNTINGTGCIGFIGGDGTNAPAINSFAANTLFYNNGAAGTAVQNNGTGNTVSNNTTNPALSPNMKNGSGNLSLFSDFVPQANATGATSAIPNYFDGFQLSWTGAYQLGALSKAAP